MARFGMILYWFSLAIAIACWIAALTIFVAKITHKLSDLGDWIAGVFFVVVGGLSWMFGRAAKSIFADI
jgi:hypothetical protein